MMSTMGRIPVIAAPTAIPVKPGSEIGVSSTRSFPNSSTRPVRTLNTVPASAISSPQMKTRASRRISSAMASLTASPSVSSRVATIVSGIDIVIHLVRSRVRGIRRELNSPIDLGLDFVSNGIQLSAIREFLFDEPITEQLDRIPLGLPQLLLLLRAVVLAVDIAHVMSVETISLADEKRRAGAGADALNHILRRRVDYSHVLAVNASALNSKPGSACQHVTG